MSTAAPSAEGMRILVVHNRYRSSMPSGENRVVDDEVEMLRDAGLIVETFFRDSDDIESFGPLRKAALAVSPTYSAEAVRDFRRVLAEFHPDVVHLHNPFPLISPWIVRVAKHAGIPVVQTVHNYRMSCPAGTFFRDGKICEDCTGKAFPWPAVQHGCYRGSRAQSLSMAVTARAHRSTWELVDRFLPVSEFVADKLVEAGVPQDRITVKYNAVDDPGAATPLGEGFLFAGRLSQEKGTPLLLEAWRMSGLGGTARLTIMGDGELRKEVERAAAVLPGVRYLGARPHHDVLAEIRAARAIVVPSRCFEGFPTTAIEALALGRPIVCTNLGALAETVRAAATGIVVEPTPAALAYGLKAVQMRPMDEAGRLARALFESRHRREAVAVALSGAYRRVVGADSAAVIPARAG